MAQPLRTKKLVRQELYTLAEVQRNGWVVIGDMVYDIKRLVDQHPGGNFLRQLLGTDITHLFLNMHSKSGWVYKMLGGFQVGAFDHNSLDIVDKEFAEMRDRFQAEGLFEHRRIWLIADVFKIGLPFCLGLWLSATSPLMALLLLTIASISLVWWIHDAGHDAIFKTDRMAKVVIEILGIVFLGMPQVGYHYLIHRIHHGFANIHGIDGALETGPVIWTEKMKKRAPAWCLALQHYLWLGLIVPLSYFILTFATIRVAWRKKSYVVLGCLVLRWVIVLGWLFQNQWWLPVVPVVIAGWVLGFTASLNHFHMPISENVDQSFIRGVLWRTQNIKNAGWFWQWLSGGLNFHIEHHLFSPMPRQNYAKVSLEIQEFCKRHNLPYYSCSKWAAIRNLYKKLKNPLANTET